MARTVIAWCLRAGAWLILLALIGRLTLGNRAAWLNGRIMQMEVLYESRRAEAALFRELGLDRHFDPARYRIHTPEFRWFKAPTWLKLMDRNDVSGDECGAYIWLEADAECVLPPLSVYSHRPDALAFEPYRVRLPADDGSLLRAAVWVSDVPSEGAESAVWIHRGDRWVNALRMVSEGGIEPVQKDSGGPFSALNYWSDSGKLRLDWDAITESFEIPDVAPPGVTILSPLPDQVELRAPPKHRITFDALKPLIQNAALDDLEKHYAAAEVEHGRDFQIPESLLNRMGYRAIALGHLSEAIRIFERNVELYPDSANAYDSLGEAYEKGDELTLALKNYEKAVEIAQRTKDPYLSMYEGNLERVRSLLGREARP